MRIALALLLAALSTPFAPAAGAQQLTVRNDGAEASRAGLVLRVTALTDTILRVRIARDGQFAEDASWAVPAEMRARRVRVAPETDGFRTAALRVRIDQNTLKMRIEDGDGNTVTADDTDPIALDGRSFSLRKALPVAERIFGMGDKTGALNRRGDTFVNWNSDTFGFSSATDPIYKSIPFFISAGGSGGGYGMLLDNSWRSWFDFAHREEDVLAMGAPDGPIDYYVIAGPRTADVVRGYAQLTGKAPLMPRWALGYQQSRWSYMSDAEVREIAGRLRKERVPTDVIWLDIDFQLKNRPFTVDPATFPNLPRLAADMKAAGIRLVAITDLHIASLPGQGYAPYDRGIAGDHFVRAADGSLYVAPVWPGPSVFPDFTRATTRQYWGSLFAPLVDAGIAGIWNDMNEPAVFDTPTKTMPLDNVHRIEGSGFAPREASHAEVHNIYGMENTRATFDGLRQLRSALRPFVMTRATFAGGQRYAATWTGDNNASWDHLKLAVQQLTNLGLSGFAYSGADVGGFTGGPSPDLLTRWIQVAAFTPLFRVHASKNTPRTEPWVDGPAHLAIRRRFIEERYRLLPYIYAVAEQNARTGDPIMRPVFYDYPASLAASCDQSMSFTLGRSLLVAGSPKPDSPMPYEICLPAGGWYDYWSGLRVEGDRQRETPRIEHLPVFVRAGTILPRQPLVQSTAETPQGPLELHVYPGEDCRGELYWDDGVSVEGPMLRQELRCAVTPKGLTIEFGKREGTYKPWWKEIAVTVHGWTGPASVKGVGPIRATANHAARTIGFTLPDQRAAARIAITR